MRSLLVLSTMLGAAACGPSRCELLAADGAPAACDAIVRLELDACVTHVSQACGGADAKWLDEYLDCVRVVPACVAGKEAEHQASAAACAALLERPGEACRAAVAAARR